LGCFELSFSATFASNSGSVTGNPPVRPSTARSSVCIRAFHYDFETAVAILEEITRTHAADWQQQVAWLLATAIRKHRQVAVAARRLMDPEASSGVRYSAAIRELHQALGDKPIADQQETKE